jgi:predicted enzyme related to lactoylglutathione lyase
MASTYIGAMGIGVSNLEQSTDFYTNIIGMKKLMTIEPSYMVENVMGFEGRGASLLLMHFTDGSNPNCKNNPVKVVIYVPDAKTIVEAARNAGYEIYRELEAVKEIGNALMAMVKDPDGYIVELIQKPPKA